MGSRNITLIMEKYITYPKVFTAVALLLLNFMAIRSKAQKTQTVTIKPTTSTLNLKIAKGQKLQVLYNGKKLIEEPPPTAERVLYSKDFSNFYMAVNAAIEQKVPLIIDSVVINAPDSRTPTAIYGDFVIRSYPGKRGKVILNFPTESINEIFAIQLGDGSHSFEGIDFVCGSQTAIRGGSCFYTMQDETTYNNVFKNCNWVGDFRYDYQSSAGHGRVQFDSCNMYAYFENIQHFGQKGTKELIMKNCTMLSRESHNIYQHPWMSDSLTNVTILGSGKLAMNNYATTILPYEALHKVYINCKNADTAKALVWNTKPMWRLWGTGDVKVKGCDIPAYEFNGKFTITDSRITNEGNGTSMPGGTIMNNCTGGATAMGTLTLNNCQMSEIIALDGSNISAAKSVIGTLYTKFNPSFFKATFTDSEIRDANINSKNADILFSNCLFPPKTIIRLTGLRIESIKFIGDSCPVIEY